MARGLVWDKENGVYQLAEFTSLEKAKAYINRIALTNVVIQNEDDYKAVWSSRTLLNSELKEVTTARKQATAVILSLFEPTLKELEKHIAEKSNELTVKLNTYKPPKEREKKSFKLEVEFNNQKALEKVTKYAIKYGGIIKQM